LIDAYRPGSSHRCECCDRGKCQRHSTEQGQAAFKARLFRARKYERQHGQDAWAQYRQHPAEKHQDRENHPYLCVNRPRAILSESGPAHAMTLIEGIDESTDNIDLITPITLATLSRFN
jgi:hypothetical protein